MSSLEAVAVKCPTCSATVAAARTGQIVCEYCLTPFTVAESRLEEEKLGLEFQKWLEQNVGTGLRGSEAGDERSRAYIFNDKIRPLLERTVNRAMEDFSSYLQYPLLQLPAPVNPVRAAANPLIQRRKQVLELSSLRSRLESTQVTSFASGEEEQRWLRLIHWRLADVMQLSNVAEASLRRDAIAYRAARRNLEALLQQADTVIDALRSSDRPSVDFLSLLKDRYRANIDVALLCEELSTPNAISGAAFQSRLQQLDVGLAAVAEKLSRCDYSPADCMSAVIGINEERKGVRLLSAWLHAYDAMALQSGRPFSDFVSLLESAYTNRSLDPLEKAGLLNVLSEFLQILSGQRSTCVIAHDPQLRPWLEQQRQRKALGLFGLEERLENLQEFALPVWVADVGFSKSSGILFVEGCEKRSVAVLDACMPRVERVVFLDGLLEHHKASMSNPTPWRGTAQVAVPLITAAAAEGFFRTAARQRGDMLNVQVKVQRLGFVPAIYGEFTSNKGRRALVGNLGGVTVSDPSVVKCLTLANKIRELLVSR